MDMEKLSLQQIEELKRIERRKHLLEIKDAARILQCPEGQKLIEYFKIIGGYYFPHFAGTELKREGFRAAVCLLDLIDKGFEQKPEAFLENMEEFTERWQT